MQDMSEPKSSATSGSATASSSALKKQRSLTPQNVIDFDALENEMRLASLLKRRLKLVDKRRSESDEDNESVSSPKKFGHDSSSLDTSKNKGKSKSSEREEVSENSEQSKWEKLDVECTGVLLTKKKRTVVKKKRLDALTYRSFLKTMVKQSGEVAEKAIERTSSIPRKFDDGALKGDALESSDFFQKRRFCIGEVHELKYREKSLILLSSESSLDSSPHDLTRKRALDNVDELEIYSLGKEDLQKNINNAARLEEIGCSTPVLLSTSSEGAVMPSFDGDLENLEMAVNVRTSKWKRDALLLESDASFAEREISDSETSSTVFMTSSPSNSELHNFFKRCVTSHEQQRLNCEDQEVCSCIARRNHDLCDIPLLEEKGRLDSNNKGICEQGNSKQIRESSLDIQMDIDVNTCVTCKLGGELSHCDGKGCRRSYHFSCRDSHLNNVPYGAWHCLHCVKRKIDFGVYSVSKGLEAIWDAREVEVSGSGGMQKEKQYFVKYKGLAHVHNCWIPEIQLLQEAPLLVAKFRRHSKEKVQRWKPEWTIPQRLLLKRLLLPQGPAAQGIDGHCQESTRCLCEWLVKWNGLGYEHATWELENAPFLSSPETMVLIRDYESRHERAKEMPDPRISDKVLLKRRDCFHKLQKLPSGFHPRLRNDDLDSVNKLCDYWHKRQSVIVMDNQDRIIRVILFILSVKSYACRPFLIISTSSALPLWENELLHLAPSASLVVYVGNKDVRKCIQTLEFHEGRCAMFHVLLSPLDTVIEDLEQLQSIEWEAIIIDECQRYRVSRHLEQFRKLTSYFLLLLHNGPVKDQVADYLNLLTILDSDGDGNFIGSLNFDSNDSALSALKERLAKFIAYERKSDSKFVEYWVPIRLSKVQLEQYCSILISNSILLRSCSKTDRVGALHDILNSVRKCCDHPYLVDASLRGTLIKGLSPVEYLDVEVNASGKLRFLDKVLPEIKNQGLRVLILFQPIGSSGQCSIGDILDDFLCQRFGPDCYERIDSGLIINASRKQAALKRFNNKESGRFVFLLESRACLPSIKLSAVDTIIIFDSDWNPLNDIKALKKICIDSQFEQLKVFRLYSPCTVEEKVLICVKQDMTLENNIDNINPATSHLLLTWGASYLFKELEEFHSCTNASVGPATDQLLLNDAVLEVLAELPHGTEINDAKEYSVLLKIQLGGATYLKNVSLFGELEMQLTVEEPAYVFWCRLLEGRFPQWRYLSQSSQRTRKRVLHFVELPSKLEAEHNEAKRKCKNDVNNRIDPIYCKTLLEDNRKVVAAEKEAEVAGVATISHGSGRLSSHFPKKSLAFSVQVNMELADYGSRRSQAVPSGKNDLNTVDVPRMTCNSSQIPEIQPCAPGNGDVARQLMQTRTLESPSPSQQDMEEGEIRMSKSSSLDCRQLEGDRRAMKSFSSNQELEEGEIREHPQCSQFSVKQVPVLQEQAPGGEEADAAVDMCTGNLPSPSQQDMEEGEIRMSKSSSLDCQQLEGDRRAMKSISSNQELEEGEISEHPQCSQFSVKKVPVLQEQASGGEEADAAVDMCTGNLPLLSHFDESVSQNIKLYNKAIRLIERVYARRRKKILSVQQEELKELMNLWEFEKEKIKKDHRLESDLISTIFDDLSVRLDKMRERDEDFARKMKELEAHMGTIKREIVSKQEEANIREKSIRAKWLDAAKSGRLSKSFAEIPLSDSGFKLKSMGAKDWSRVHIVSEDANLMSGTSLVPENVNATISEPVDLMVEGGSCVEATEKGSNHVPGSNHREPVSLAVHPAVTSIGIVESDEMGTAASEARDNDRVDKHSVTNNTDDATSNSSAHACKSPGLDNSISSQQLSSTNVRSSECNQPIISASEEPLLQPILQCQLATSTDPISVGPNLPDTPAVSGIETESINELQLTSLMGVFSAECDGGDALTATQGEGSISSQQPQAIMQQPVEAITSNVEQYTHFISEINMQSTMPLPITIPLGGMPVGNSGRTRMLQELIHPALSPMTTQTSPVPYLDPLRNELAKLQKQDEEVMRKLEDVKLQLETERQKEIAEVCRKYDGFIQDEDIAFMEKKKMLEAYLSKVHLNMVLAEAIRFKFADAKRGGPPSTPGLPTTLSLQFPMQPLPHTAMRPLRPRAPIRVMHQSPLFSSNPPAPHSRFLAPANRDISSCVNLRIGTQLWAPAHLQPFRPTFMSAPGQSLSSNGILSHISPAQRTMTPSLQSQVNQPQSLRELNFDTWYPSGPMTMSREQGNAEADTACPCTPVDVVCLSDDD